MPGVLLRVSSSSISKSKILTLAAVAAFGAASRADAISYAPSQIRSAYSLSGFTFGSTGQAATGAGQTIAIIDWFNDPNILTETAKFNSAYGLQGFNASGGPTLKVVGQDGSATLPPTTTGSLETALDVQWAHAMAPQANIVLVEPKDNSNSNINVGLATAKSYAGVSVISMSYGSNDTSGSNSVSQESLYTQPSGHTGVTFVASTGDKSVPSSPATSTHVIALGGTNLVLSGSVRSAETVWNNTTNSAEGTGFSGSVPRPTFQDAVSGNSKRGIPDLVMDADPDSGVNVYDGPGVNSTLYTGIGGTSLAAPLFAGLMAVANQGRKINGLDVLTSDQALSMIYALNGTALYSTCFYDVTSGTANGYTAGTGFDTPSGMGAPIASGLLNYLAGFTTLPEPSTMACLFLPIAALMRRRRN